MVRRFLDRILAAVASVAITGFFRTFEVDGRRHLPQPGTPVLVVANHFNGFVDPVALVKVLGRLPRFLAKATLWDVVVARPFLKLAGLIPVHRAVDGPGTEQNRSAFHACHEVLAHGETVAIFPEGTTHDEAQLAEVRTGAARIALGARHAGVQGLQILPIGLSFEDKISLRSRLLVRVGRPIDLDDVAPRLLGAGPPGEDNHPAVRALTEQVDHALRGVSPDYHSVRDRAACTLAAEIATRPTGGARQTEPSLGQRERLAQQLGRQPADVRKRVRAVVADYHLDLLGIGVTDAELVAGYDLRRLLVRLVLTTVATVVLVPLALLGLVTNVVPYLAVRWSGSRVAAPVTKGTVRLLVAAGAFPLTWWLLSFLALDRWTRIVAGMVVLAVCGLVAVRLSETLVALVDDLRGYRAMHDRRALVATVLERRQAVVDFVETAAAA